MKKLFTIITLLMSSLFLFSINEVRAATYNVNIEETNFDLINDEFLTLREKGLAYIEENNIPYYAIVYNANQSSYYFLAGTSSNLSNYTTLSNGYQDLVITINNVSLYELKDDVFTYDSFLTILRSYIFSKGVLVYYFLDTNMALTYNLGHEYNFTYNDITYTIEDGSTIPTLYEIYLDTHKPVDPYEDEKIIVNNFYSTIFTKIANLATFFASNYIFLLIFGIFILIFVFELIRRRLL